MPPTTAIDHRTRSDQSHFDMSVTLVEACNIADAVLISRRDTLNGDTDSWDWVIVNCSVIIYRSESTL